MAISQLCELGKFLCIGYPDRKGRVTFARYGAGEGRRAGADLNVVGLRNVPPPTNDAQRSGRVGRSGQPAIVVTYCSTGSPHDQWFFRRPHLMVAGAVSPPRLDVANEDLVRAHVQAVWPAETNLDLKRSLGDLSGLPLGRSSPRPLSLALRASRVATGLSPASGYAALCDPTPRRASDGRPHTQGSALLSITCPWPDSALRSPSPRPGCAPPGTAPVPPRSAAAGPG